MPQIHLVKPQGSAPLRLQSLFNQQAVETFASGRSIFWEGDAATHVFDILEGAIRIVKFLSGGRRVITGFFYPGDLVGLSLKDPYFYNAEAVTRTKLRRFARGQFDEAIARAPELRPQMVNWLCDEMAAAQDQMVLLARKTAEERVCSFLVLAARRMGHELWSSSYVEVLIPPRLDLADYLGLTKETVSRTLSKLVGLGVIGVPTRQAVLVRNVGSLALHAGNGDEEDNRIPASARD